MRLVQRAKELVLRAFIHGAARRPLVETAQYYVAAIVGHPDRNEAVYGLIRLSAKEAARIMELNSRLAAGDRSVREERQRFFEARRGECIPTVGKMDRCELGDLIPVGEVDLALGRARSGQF